MKCWGWNTKGQLGLGSRIDYNSPQAVDLGNGKTAKAISAGANHTCAILNDDSLKCWGKNSQGQLGLGRHNKNAKSTAPEAVNLGTGKTAKAITVGANHTCAILNDDSLKCWGGNNDGKLGLPDSQTDSLYNSPQAVDLGNGKTAKAITIWSDHSCAILNDDSLKCWGLNDNGRLGIGSIGGNHNIPHAVSL